LSRALRGGSALLVSRRGCFSAGERAERILLAEDTEDNRFLIRNYLSKTSHVLVEVEDGEQALDAVVSSEEPFDLILMDMQMPVMDGYEATRRIREWEQELGRERVTIVALTAYAKEAGETVHGPAGLREKLGL